MLVGDEKHKVAADTDGETKYVRRVHHIVEYMVPCRLGSNYFGNSRLPLIQAVEQGDLHWVRQILLRTDTNPDTRSFQGWTALQQACSVELGSPACMNQKAIVELLVSRGADINARPGDGLSSTALQAACKQGNQGIVELLLVKGAEVNADFGPHNGKGALASAVWSRNIEIVKTLLHHGADIDSVPNRRELRDRAYSPLSAAAQLGDIQMLDLLLTRGATIHGPAGLTALESAISWNQLEFARRLLELGVDINGEHDGSAPVHAITSMDMLELAVAYGGRMDLPCSRPRKWTSLQHAARYCYLELVIELIRLGANVHDSGPTIRGRSALQSAAARFFEGGVDIMRCLVEHHGADVNEPRSREEGYTSLEAACHEAAPREISSSLDIIEFLVRKGAIIIPFTLHYAAPWNHMVLLEFLLENGACTEDLRSTGGTDIVVERNGDFLRANCH